MPPRKTAAAASKKPTAAATRKKQAAQAAAAVAEVDNDDDVVADAQTEEAAGADDNQDVEEEEEDAAAADDHATASGSSSAAASMEDRMAKMRALRQRMTESAKANRQDLISEANAKRDSARNLAKLERKRKQVEAMGEKQEARETGEDLERKRAWDYTIEDNEKWDKKLARKGRRGDFSFTDYDDIARRKYKKDMDTFKPDLASYNKQRTAAQQSLALVASAESGTISNSNAAQDLYRDANSFVYADHKPSEDAIDRVIGKINMDLDKRQKRSRERKNEDEGDITYINEKNKHFNKKLNRYYDSVTKETRDAFERGTAL